MQHQKNTTLRISYFLFWISIYLIYPTKNVAQKPAGKFPSFRIALTNSNYYTSSKLKKVPVLFVYFKPDCDECKSFTTEMLDKIKTLKTVQIVMITNTPLNQVKDFEREFNIKKYPIILGTEGFTMHFLRQFNIQQFPFVMLYNKEGRLINQYTHAATNEIFRKIEQDLKKLQED